MKRSLCCATCQVLLSAVLLGAIPALGEVLVTRDGEHLQIRGPWQVKGSQVIFTLPGGTLSSLRLSEVDLEASQQASEATARPAAEAAPPPARGKARAPVLTITDEDVGQSATAGQTDIEMLAQRFRDNLEKEDLDSLLSLVHFDASPPVVRVAFRRTFESILGREVLSVDLQPLEADDTASLEWDGVTYQPNLEVSDKLIIELAAGESDEGEPIDPATLSFLVGRALGSPRLAAAAAVDGDS